MVLSELQKGLFWILMVSTAKYKYEVQEDDNKIFIGQEIPLGNGQVFITRPPLCILMEKRQWKHKKFHSLAPAVVPIFAEETSISFKARAQPFNKKQQNFSAKRLQIPISLEFAITAHKAQGRTFSKAVLDLKKPKLLLSISKHQMFYLIYIILL